MLKKDTRSALPMDLQFFAEAEDNAPEGQTEDGQADIQEDNPQDNPQDDNPQDDAQTLEKVMAELAKERAEKEKNKLALDKALKETGELKKTLRQKMTSQEQEDEAKKELEEQHKAYVADLEAFKHKTEAKDRYLMQGLTAEMAIKAAEAEVSGDMDALAAIQKQHTDAIVKQKEAEWKKSRPHVNAGTGDEQEEDAFLKGFNSVGTKFASKNNGGK